MGVMSGVFLSFIEPRASDPYLLLLATAFLLGLRHGIDWDHIAALADLTSTPSSPRSAMTLGTLYAGGHGLMLLLIGGAAVLAGAAVPEALDAPMEKIVGATLLLLGLVLILSLLLAGRGYRPRSRWMLLIAGGLGAYDWARETLTGRPRPQRNLDGYTRRAAFGMGMLHGIGAETPTQVLLFAAAADAGGRLAGFSILLLFVGGLLCSNSGLSGLFAHGYSRARGIATFSVGLACVTGVFSVAVGTLFLTGNGSLLPALFGG
jgi:hypothetical protein